MARARKAEADKAGVKQKAVCSLCGKPVDPSYKPFCSKRCADLDLNRWLNGAYVIAGDSSDEEGDEPLAEHEPSRDDF